MVRVCPQPRAAVARRARAWGRDIPAHALSVALAGHEHLGAALSQYEAGLRGRVASCRTITGFTKVLAAMPEASGLMKFVPQPLNGWVFDAFLDLSLSGAGTYRGPATSASCAKAGRKR